MAKHKTFKKYNDNFLRIEMIGKYSLIGIALLIVISLILFHLRTKWVAQLKSFLNDKRISLDGYNLIPSFQHDIESGLSSKFFNLNEHNSQDSRKGLDEVSKLEILKIMDTKKITFDEARLEFTRSKFSENNIAEDGTPLDPRAVTFGK